MLPAIGAPQTSDEKPDKPPLNLSLAITDRGNGDGADAVLYPKALQRWRKVRIAPDHPKVERRCL